MKHSFKLFLLLYCLAILACGKQTAEPIDTASLHLSFRATYDSEPLVLETQEYEYKGNAIKFTQINFFLSNLVAINDDGETELSEIQFIDLAATHNTAANAANGAIMNFGKVPVGAYNYLSFGIGVPSDLNKTSPADYATSHPLGANNSSEYREDLGSYIFVRIEGEYDEDGSGVFDEQDLYFEYHAVGTGSFYPILEFNNALTLNAGETTNLNFELDVKKLFAFTRGEFITLQPHDATNKSAEINRIMDNFMEALQLN